MIDRRLRLVQGSTEFAQGIIDLLDETAIEIKLPDNPDWEEQLAAELVVEILGRLFPRIAISGGVSTPLDPRLPALGAASTIGERLALVRQHGVAPQPTGATEFTVAVGRVTGPADIYCDGSGWQSYVGPVPSELIHENGSLPVGALAAGCRAAAWAFARVMARFDGQLPTLEPTYSSALTYRTSGSPLEEPGLSSPTQLIAVLAGVGSVGGAAAYTLARVPGLDGVLDVVDPQQLESHNPDRAILATEALAAAGAAKVDVAEAALAGLPLAVRKHQMTFEQWAATRPREAGLPLVLCSFDSIEARRELQDCLPLEVANAACGADRVMLSGHRTGAGPCVYCLYIGDVLDRERIRFKLIVEATGLPPGHVQGLLESRAPLSAQHLEAIERHRGLDPGALSAYAGQTLDELYVSALMYAEHAVQRDGNVAAVAAPFVTALAGVLLAGEGLKACAGGEYELYRLGPWGEARNCYDETPREPAHGYTSIYPRWPDERCLCRSARRVRLLRERYNLGRAQEPGA